MDKRCYRTLSSHLKKHLRPNSRLMLAVSGGSDSMALLHLLIEAKEHFPFTLSLVHVDHGWRSDAAKEAEALQKFGLPFYTTRLALDKTASDAEDKAREARYHYFVSLQEKFDALVLAHHRDDLAETVLKRLFEGASLPKVYGMRPVDHIRGMEIWRPLLSLSKKNLLDYLGERPYFIDETNGDERFLRARMRSQLVPALEAAFGKGIDKPLYRIAEASGDLYDYLEKKCEKYWDNFQGDTLDLAPLHPVEKIELFHFVKKLFAKYNLVPSHEILDTIGKMIEKGVSGKRVRVGDLELTIECQKLKTNLSASDRIVPSSVMEEK